MPGSVADGWPVTRWRYSLVIGVLVAAIAVVGLNLTAVLRHKSGLEQRLDRIETVMSALVLQSGYGGFIHNFKNAVLRPSEKQRYLAAFRSNIDVMTEVIAELEVLLPEADTALAVYSGVLAQYATMAEFIETTDMTDSQAIDRIVRVRDAEALEGVVVIVDNAERVMAEVLAGFLERVIMLVALLGILCLFAMFSVFAMVASFRSHERRIQQALSVRLLAADMIEGIGAALIQIGPDGDVLLANSAARTGFAHLLPPVGQVATEWFETQFGHRADDPLALAFDGKAVRNAIGEYLGPDGTPQFIMVTSVPLRSSLGQGAVMIELRDETAGQVAKMVEDRKLRLATLGTFAGGVIHDFRNVFATISMALNGLRAKSTPETPLSLLRAADGALDLGQHLADRLLRFVVDGSERPEQVSLRLVMKELGLLSAATIDSGIAVSIPDVDKGASLWGSRTGLATALVNLIMNARDALRTVPDQTGRIEITVEADTATFGIPAWAIKVADNGPGFPESVLDEFAGEGPVRSENGFGIGLSVVSAVATEMGGIVTATNRADGAEVTLVLPAYLVDPSLLKV